MHILKSRHIIAWLVHPSVRPFVRKLSRMHHDSVTAQAIFMQIQKIRIRSGQGVAYENACSLFLTFQVIPL